MLHIDSNDQGTTAVFALSVKDRPRAGLDVPRQVCLTVDEDHFTGSPVEVFTDRWLLVASMLTGLTCPEVEAEGFEVRKLVGVEWEARTVPVGTVFIRNAP